MKIFTLLVLIFPLLLNGQTRIDGSFSFDTDPAKKYSLFIPSEYDGIESNKVMLALHPFNTDRWDAKSWCDTLIDFAEENQVILVCPDGGVDGKIDDPIDTAFTSALIDSVSLWYNLNFDKFYGIGFSWGSRGIYTYGLTHGNLIKGYIPVGAAINGTTEVNESLQLNSTGIPFYIVHGSSDAPTIRFYPIRDSLIAKAAIVETNLLSGIGHTIDFPDRNEILTVAFNWIDSVNCSALSIIDLTQLESNILCYPNPVKEGESFNLDLQQLNEGLYSVEIRSIDGRLILNQTKYLVSGPNEFNFELNKGNFILHVSNNFYDQQFRIVVQ